MLSNTKAGFLDRCLSVAQHGWPAHCVLCAAAGVEPARRFCRECDAALPRLPRARCAICALPLTSGLACGPCVARPPYYDGVCAPYAYAFPVDALIQAYKYGHDLTLAPVLGAAMVSSAPEAVDAIVPMPLAPARLRERGFNQAQELARYAAKKLAVPVLARACRRVVETAPQAALPWSERARNVRGAFVCDADIEGLHVAVVDDVMTTGATLNELARNLKRAGARRITAWVVARTLRHSGAD